MSYVLYRGLGLTIVDDYDTTGRVLLAPLVALWLGGLHTAETIVLDIVDLWRGLCGLVLSDVDGEAGGEEGFDRGDGHAGGR